MAELISGLLKFFIIEGIASINYGKIVILQLSL